MTKSITAYKLARPDGWDFFTGNTINYRDSIGKSVHPPEADVKKGICSSGVLHASENPNDCFIGAKIPCSAYLVRGIPRVGDKTKWGFTSLRVEREVIDLDNLFGWQYSEAVNPIHPFLLPTVTTPAVEHLKSLTKWASVWASVGDSVRASVGDSVWASVGDSVRASVWASVRASVGDSVWASVGDSVWGSVWDSVGDSVWDSVRASVGDSVWDSVWASVRDSVWASVRASVRGSVWDSVGAYIGSMYPHVTDWKYAPKSDGYPYQPSVDLWKQGIVPSFDGKLWRLHSGPTAQVIWQGTVKEALK